MRIGVVGTGYVGLVQGVIMAEFGFCLLYTSPSPRDTR